MTMNGIISRKGTSLGAIAVVLVAAPVAALAQEKTSSAQPAPATTADKSGLEDIVVTASRRAEDVQKESRAIAVVGAQELTRQGVTDPTAVQKLVPGLTVVRNGGQLQVSVRGVGDRTINSATDPAIAISLDGVYYPRSFQASASFFDLERVEVLKGPQGTLYGRNSSAGAINLIVAKPRFETSGFGEFEYGNYNEKRGTAAINVALGSTAALRVSGQVVDRDGYLTDGYNDDKEQAVRAQLLIAPTPDTSLLLTGSYSHLGGHGDASVVGPRFDGTATISPVPNPTNPYAGPTDAATLARIAATNPGTQNRILRNGYQDISVYTFAAEFVHHMDWGTITVLPSYVGSKIQTLQYAALVVPSYLNSKSNSLALEARLSSPAGNSIQWVIGAYGSLEDVNDESQSQVGFPGPGGSFVTAAISPQRNDRTVAGFGEVTASVTSNLRLIAGGRYTWEKKTIVGYTAQVFGPIPQFPLFRTDTRFPASGLVTDGELTSRAFNYRAGVEYDVATRSMVYATVSSGFKAGGFYANAAPNNTYRPEKLTAYQAGSKNRFFDNRLQINVEGFYWDYKDKQETFVGTLPVGTVLQTRNAGKVSLYGADLSVVGQITHNDMLSGEVEYLHSKYDTYIYSYVGAVDPTINCPKTSAAGTVTVNCSGKSLVRAPQWSGRVSYVHNQPLGNAGDLSFSASMTFSSSYNITNNFTALTHANPYQLYDAALTWTAPGKRVAVTAFIKNIGNTPVYTGGTQSTSFTDGAALQIAAPRTFGGRIRYTF